MKKKGHAYEHHDDGKAVRDGGMMTWVMMIARFCWGARIPQPVSHVLGRGDICVTFRPEKEKVQRERQGAVLPSCNMQVELARTQGAGAGGVIGVRVRADVPAAAGRIGEPAIDRARGPNTAAAVPVRLSRPST